MILDCPDVQQVIHWGPTAEIEAYIKKQYKLEEMDTCYMLCSSILQQITSEYSKTTSVYRQVTLEKTIVSCTLFSCCDVLYSPRCACMLCYALLYHTSAD